MTSVCVDIMKIVFALFNRKKAVLYIQLEEFQVQSSIHYVKHVVSKFKKNLIHVRVIYTCSVDVMLCSE